MGRIINFIKGKVKEAMAEKKALNQEIMGLTDKELKRKAINQGGAYADAWVERKKRAIELNKRLK